MPMPLAARLLALLLVSASTVAQPVAFGSADDLFELGSGRPERDHVEVGVFAGPAYLPDTWRGGVRAEFDGISGRVSLGLGRTIHPAAGGLYGPEADDLYDLTRLVRYLRLNPTARSPVYGRLGPTERVSLLSGALARGYRTTTAWDERGLGAEAAVTGDHVAAGAFVDDLRLRGVAGGQIEFRSDLSAGPVRDLRVGLAAVHDLGIPGGLRGDSALVGVEATVSGLYVGDGTFDVSPFVTHARYLGQGSTLGVGVDAGVDNLGNALRGRARVAVFASTARFVPGLVGPFYALDNTVDRIVEADSYYDADPAAVLVGTPIDSLRSGLDVVVDLRVLAFGRFEVAQHVRRHFGPDASSAYGLRLAARLPQGARFEFALERQGFRGLLGIFGDLGERNLLVLDLGAPVTGSVSAFVRSRYGYRRLPDEELGPGRYLIERRFEPLVGIRLRTF